MVDQHFEQRTRLGPAAQRDRAVAFADRPRARRGHLRDRALEPRDGGHRPRRRHRRRRLPHGDRRVPPARAASDDGLGRAAALDPLRLLVRPARPRADPRGGVASRPSARPRSDGRRRGRREARPRRRRPVGSRKPPRAPPAKPDLRIVQTQVFRGPNYFSYDPAIRLVVDLGSLEHWPSNTIDGFNDDAARAPARASASIPARAGTPAGSANGSRKARGPGTSPSTSRSSCSASRARRSTGARPAAPGTPGRYNVIYGYWEEQVGACRRPPRGPARQPPRQAGDGVRLLRGARAADPARRAPSVRPLDPGDPRRGGEPRHPVHPAERPVPRAARPGQVPAAHPRHDDVA